MDPDQLQLVLRGTTENEDEPGEDADDSGGDQQRAIEEQDFGRCKPTD
jgi:hypothetical protein